MPSVYPPENAPSWEISPRYIARGEKDEQCVLKPGSLLSTDDVGLSMLRRVWQCRTDLVPEFLPKKGQQDFLHSRLHVDTWAVRHSEGWRSEIDVSLVGINSTSDLQNRSVENRRPDEVTFTSGRRSVTIKYFSPTITTSFIAANRPPENTLPRVQPGTNIQMENCIINGLDQTESNRLRLSLPALMAEFDLSTRVDRTDFSREQIGDVWRCQETCERVICERTSQLYVFTRNAG